MISWRTCWAILRKEMLHIFRDGQTWVLVVFTPALLLVTFAYLFSFDVSHFSIMLLDQDQTPTSRSYVQALTADGVLRLQGVVWTRAEADSALVRSQGDTILIIPPGFERNLLADELATVQAAVDGSDPNTASRALGEISARSGHFTQHVTLRVASSDGLFQVEDKVWYNPALKSLVSMVPGLLAVVLVMPAFSAAQALAKEKELGTLESLLATPIGRIELVLGKGLPYLVTGMLGILLTAAVAVLWFRVPFRGSFGLFLLLGLDFLFASNFVALFLANFVESQQAAMIVMFIVFFLPSFFLSGLIDPIDSASLAARIEGALMPASYFVTITRGIFLKGVSLRHLWEPALSLLLTGAGGLILAVASFRRWVA